MKMAELLPQEVFSFTVSDFKFKLFQIEKHDNVKDEKNK